VPGLISASNNSVNTTHKINLLKQEIENLKTRLSQLEQLAEKKNSWYKITQ